MEPFLYGLCVPRGFGEKAGYDMSTSHIFPQDVLAALTLVRGGAGDRVAKARVRCESGFFLFTVSNSTLLGVEVGSQVTGTEALGVGSKLVLFSKCVFSPIPALAHLPQRGAVLEQEWLGQALGVGLGPGYGDPGPSHGTESLLMCSLCKCQ